MEKNLQKIGKWKNMTIAAIGFGIGGLLWGLEAYRGTVGAGESFTNPFSYILGAVALGVFGGLALSYFSAKGGSASGGKRRGAREAAKIIGLGTLGWLVAFLLPAVRVEWMMVVSSIITPLIFFIIKLTGFDVVPLFVIKPSLVIGQLWFHFLITGATAGLVYSLTFKTKILRTILWSAGGFALASLIGPIIGNLVGNLFNVLLLNYILTFGVICVIFGICLSVGMRRKQTETSGTT